MIQPPKDDERVDKMKMYEYLLQAEHLISKGYPVPYLDKFRLAEHLYQMNEERSK